MAAQIAELMTGTSWSSVMKSATSLGGELPTLHIVMSRTSGCGAVSQVSSHVIYKCGHLENYYA